MKAFISYSHNDDKHLKNLEKHLAQVKRDGLLQTWTDQAIEAGGVLDGEISDALTSADIFLALLSPDYINSQYCYEKEFKKAQELHKTGSLKIVPVIVEPCDWHSTPFGSLKALPKDGKAVVKWNNMNTAFVDIVTQLRKILKKEDSGLIQPANSNNGKQTKYKSKKDFDSIEKMNFVSKAFDEIRKLLNDNISEVIQVEGIKAQVLNDNSNSFVCLLMNRNKVNVEAKLLAKKPTEELGNQGANRILFGNKEHNISFNISNKNNSIREIRFDLSYDDYHMFWEKGRLNNYSNTNSDKEMSVKKIVEFIWAEWLHEVGIDF